MKYVWVVKCNSDMTEGRGPMLLDSVWADNREEVAAYIDGQPGCMGRMEKWSEKSYGDWTMERVPVFESVDRKHENKMAALREKVISRLNDEELEALGIEA